MIRSLTSARIAARESSTAAAGWQLGGSRDARIAQSQAEHEKVPRDETSPNSRWRTISGIQ